MGLGININENCDDHDAVDDGDCGGDSGVGGKSLGYVSCSICLETVTEDGGRSWAKLQCGHQFHLDCIGSAFNVKGVMQCPNCRKIEKGHWLYANGCRSCPEFSTEDWTHDEDLYDLGYPEMSVGVHWCPFGSLTRLPSLFEDGEFSPSSYHDFLGQHTVFAEQTPMPSGTHPCPYVAYFAPAPPSSSNTGRSVPESSNFNNPWTSSVPGEMRTPYVFPAMDVHHHSWEQHASPFGGAGGVEQSSIPSVTHRSSRTSSDTPRLGPFVHPFLVGHSSTARPGNVAPSMIRPYPGSNARARDRIQALQAYYQQQQPSSSLLNPGTNFLAANWRSNGGAAQAVPVASSSDQTNGFYFNASNHNSQETEHPLPGRFPSWDRDQLASFSLNHTIRDLRRGAFYQGTDSSGPLWQSYGSGRTPSQSHQ